MLSEIKAHFSHYLALVVWLLIGLSTFVLVSFSIPLKLVSIIVMSAGYVIWGIMHHHYLKDLTLDIVLEYMLNGALFVVIIGATLLYT